ncbi:hypothetical protein H072_10619 [Dactylellina haptotyla CBS 200.50]|uniref:Uncharacterized protein n=1 Tax=Dactylellina haptotyla (strain CBS 200.50) TaxID=1284197 RepID=S8BL51_DACHA|nr:hypothetical protein H072_10619 [Dactylellina haptotyla CBS 200.50]
MRFSVVSVPFILFPGLGVLANPLPIAEFIPSGPVLARSTSNTGSPGGQGAGSSQTLGSKWIVPAGYEVLIPVAKPIPSQLLKRADQIQSVFQPKTSVKLEYNGVSRPDRPAPTAKVDVTVDEKHPILELVHVRPLVEHVEVFEKGPNLIGMVFNSQDMLKIALKAWDWVNNDQNDYFTLIVMSADPKNSDIIRRLPYKIDKVNQNGLKVTLTATEIPWTTIGDLDIRIGATHPEPNTARPPTASNISKRLIDLDDTWPLNLAAGEPNNQFNLIGVQAELSKNGPVGTVQVKCVDCYSGGTFEVGAHFHYGLIKGLTEANVAFRTRNISASVGLEVNAAITERKKWRHQLIGADPAGMVLFGMVNFGPSIALDVVKEISIAGKFSVTAKMKMMLPDDEIYLDFLSPKNSHGANWLPKTEWEATINEASVELKGVAGMVANAGVTAQVFGHGVKSGLNLWIPRLEYGGKVGYSENLCPASGNTTARAVEPKPRYGSLPKIVSFPNATVTEEPTKVHAFGFTASAQAGVTMEITALEGTGALSFLQIGGVELLNKMFTLVSICKAKVI